jgi:hypothetical protein
MNLEELSAVVTILTAGLVGSIAASEHRTGISSILLGSGGAVAGLLAGYIVTHVAHRFAYVPLDRASCRASPKASFGYFILSLVLPMLSFATASVATFLLVTSISRLVP